MILALTFNNFVLHINYYNGLEIVTSNSYPKYGKTSGCSCILTLLKIGHMKTEKRKVDFDKSFSFFLHTLLNLS